MKAQSKYKLQSPVFHWAFSFLFCCLVLLASFSQAHPPAVRHEFHVSVMQVDHNPQSNALEVTLKVFTDDLENSLHGLGAPTLRLGSPRELPAADTILSQYLNNRIAFFVDDQQVAFDYLGKEVELDNTTWCYVEVAGIEQFRSLTIRNKVLTELFEDQSNLVHISAFGEKRSLLLRGNAPEETAQF